MHWMEPDIFLLECIDDVVLHALLYVLLLHLALVDPSLLLVAQGFTAFALTPQSAPELYDVCQPCHSIVLIARVAMSASL